MPVEVVQFCWKYNSERLKKLPELAGCEVCNFISEIGCFPGAVCLSSHSALYCELESIWLFLPMKHCIAIQLRTSLLNSLNHNIYHSTESIVLQGCKPISCIGFNHCPITVTPHLWNWYQGDHIIYQMHAPEHWHQLHDKGYRCKAPLGLFRLWHFLTQRTTFWRFFQVKLRMEGDNPFVTDNSNYIIELYFKVLTWIPPL